MAFFITILIDNLAEILIVLIVVMISASLFIYPSSIGIWSRYIFQVRTSLLLFLLFLLPILFLFFLGFFGSLKALLKVFG